MPDGREFAGLLIVEPVQPGLPGVAVAVELLLLGVVEVVEGELNRRRALQRALQREAQLREHRLGTPGLVVTPACQVAFHGGKSLGGPRLLDQRPEPLAQLVERHRRIARDEQARIVAMSYDYTVLAGTQGMRNHQKKDRLLQLAEKWRLPIVFFTEGGGGAAHAVVAGTAALDSHGQRAGAIGSLSVAEQSVGHYFFGGSSSLTPAQAQAVRDYLFGAWSSLTPAERSVGSYLFGESESLTPDQRRVIHSYLVAASGR